MMTSRAIRRVPDMLSELGLQASLEHPFRQLGQQPTGADQAHGLRLGPLHNTAARSSVGIFLASNVAGGPDINTGSFTFESVVSVTATSPPARPSPAL